MSKDKAEAAKLAAEAEKFQAEARYHEAEARKATAEAEAVEIELERERRKRAEELALDKYHHVYHFTSETSAAAVRACMGALSTWHRLDPGCDIEIVFCSPGGSVVDGLALFDFIQQMRRDGHDVVTSTIGMAASMAGILLQAGDERVMSKESWLLIHEASFGVMGSFGDVEDRVEWIRRIQERILDIFAARSTLTKKQIARRWHRKDWWLSSDEALKLGFIDRIA